MLVESIVRRTLRVKRHVVKSVEETDAGLVVRLELRRGRRLPCGVWGELGRVRDRLRPRSWKHVPLWGIPATLMYAPARVACACCGKVNVEAIPSSEGKSRLSKGLIRLPSSLSRAISTSIVTSE